ncbi:MAG: cytochrome c3 family protein [Bryobacteraceae bacterium]
MQRIDPIVIFVSLALLQPLAGQTEPSADDPSAACMECHTGNAESKRGSTEIDPEAWGKSTHASILGCTGCHSEGFGDYPHKGKRADAPDCVVCHSGDDSLPFNRAKIEADVKASVHVTLLAKLTGNHSAEGQLPEFRCTNCHYPHDFRPVRAMESVAEAVRVGNAVCLQCHGAANPRNDISAEQVLANLTDKHAFIPMWELHTKAARCVDCHTPGKEETIHRILPASQAQRDCVQCHSRDSLLLRKLYKHAAERERSEGGIINSVIYNDAYMIGATKYEWLDRLSLAVFGIALVAIALHALGRWAGARRRRP